jgi:endo-1,4-beta-mannosidase
LEDISIKKKKEKNSGPWSEVRTFTTGFKSDNDDTSTPPPPPPPSSGSFVSTHNANFCTEWFKDYISMLLNRVNTVTGVAYKDEPAIFAWQIMNEGRNKGKHQNILRDWYQGIAKHIKSIDPNHLVSTGEEGFDEGTPSQYSVDQYSNTYVLRANEGTSYIANTSIPEIDFGSAHWYPGDYGFGTTVNTSFLNAQKAWLNDHKNIAENVGKPFYIGEFGLAGWGDSRVNDMYDALYKHAEEIKLDGNLLWQLIADGTKCWEFGGNICYPCGRADTDLYNKFKQHVTNMKGLN